MAPINSVRTNLRRATTLALGAFAITSSGGCHRVSTAMERGVDLNARRSELAEANRAAQVRTAAGRFIDGFTSLFAPGGIYVTAGPLPGRGPEQARSFLNRDTLNATSAARWTVLRSDVSADGRDAYTYGYFDVVHAAGDTVPGRYHAYWRRSDAGHWQILAFTRAQRAPGARTETAPASYANTARSAPWFPMRDSTEAFKAVTATESAFCDSAAANLGAAFAGFAAPDVSKFGGGSEYVFGPAEIAKLFDGAPVGAGPLWRPEAGTVATSNDLAFTYGPAWARQSGLQDPPATAGRYFTVWHRQPDGTWRYVVD
jgi:ketosteroid isomerase-like protein